MSQIADYDVNVKRVEPQPQTPRYGKGVSHYRLNHTFEDGSFIGVTRCMASSKFPTCVLQRCGMAILTHCFMALVPILAGHGFSQAKLKTVMLNSIRT